MKIIQEKSKCIGCGTCASLCAKHFEMRDDGKAHLIGSDLTDKAIEKYEKTIEELSCAKEAVEGCPVQCIEIKNK
jgi:ferredoxin